MSNNASLKPLRIAAVPDAVLDIVVDSPLVRLEAAIQQTTLADTPKDTTVQDTPKEDTTLNLTTSPVSNSPRRNPVYGLVEVAMENYSHIDHPDFRPKPRAPQFVPTAEQVAERGEVANEATPNASNINAEPVNGNAKSTHNKSPNNAQIHRSPQDHTAVAAIKDISPIVVKASLGDARSQVELGDMYRTGDRIEQDFEVARHWYLKAANQGDPAGQCNLGHLYRLETESRTEPLDSIGLVHQGCRTRRCRRAVLCRACAPLRPCWPHGLLGGNGLVLEGCQPRTCLRSVLYRNSI
ncbi:MAG: hypothetical protein JOS17DRAFT_536814 [Linnemannia elongata]|nr:MAG: hypothetical protein JOS17DRAFT_536814 [Linnemannia elongata]